MELFWFNYQLSKAMVQGLWGQQSGGHQGLIRNFDKKIQILHKALSLWQMEAFGELDRKLDFCKKVISFFDRIEEMRVLQDCEFRLRMKIKEKAFELANNIELKWKQRSRCNWLANEDRNSKFFHAFASSRLSRNLVKELEVNGLLVSDPNQILEVFTNSMKELLRTEQQVLPFKAEALYPINSCLQQLGVEFTMEEVETAVKQLANNKASGPDGILNKFIKLYWGELKYEILEIMANFYENRLDLKQFN
ncbi:uncharacterized protein LOC144544288 [Carex rostrata]